MEEHKEGSSEEIFIQKAKRQLGEKAVHFIAFFMRVIGHEL